jgi:hypothetical protein
MYSIKQERNFKSHKKNSNNMHYRMIMCFSVNLAVVTVVTTLGFPPTAILSTLPMIAQLGGCGDVINFGTVNLGQLKDLGNVVG